MRLDKVTGDVLSDSPAESTILFSVPANYRMNGIGEVLDREYGMRRGLESYGFNLCPDCIYICPCLILVAEQTAEIIPSIEAITTAFERCRLVCEHEGIQDIVMPPLFTKYHKWAEIERIIKQVFAGTCIGITVYFRSKK